MLNIVFSFLNDGDLKSCSLVCGAWNWMSNGVLFEHVVVPGRLTPESTISFLESSRRLVEHVRSLVICGATLDISGPLLVQTVLLLNRAQNLSFVSMDRVRLQGPEWFQIVDLDPLRCVRLGLQRCSWANPELRFVLAASANVREMAVSDDVVFPDMSTCHRRWLSAWKERLGGEWGEGGRCSPTSIIIDGRGVAEFWTLFGNGLSAPVYLERVRELVLLGIPGDDMRLVAMIGVCCHNLTVLKCILPGNVLPLLIRL